MLTVAVVQPRPFPESRAEANVRAAVEAIVESAAGGASLVLFPEGYPGPIRVSSTYDATASIADAAARHGVAVCWSRVEAGADGRYYKVAYVHGPSGEQLLRYVRSHPATGDVHPALSGAPLAPGPAVADLFEVDGVPCGLLICSELWLPEVARILTVRGAEMLLAPAGGGFGAVAGNWQLIARARAIENQAFVALTQNLFGSEKGAALIAGPESDVTATGSSGVLLGELDLERVRWLRAQDDSMTEPKPFRSLPGLLRARRPELYSELAEPVAGLYDYDAASPAAGVSR